MKRLICDVCGYKIDASENSDENGYTKFVNIEVRNSRTFGGEFDLCNICFKKSLKYLHRLDDTKENNE